MYGSAGGGVNRLWPPGATSPDDELSSRLADEQANGVDPDAWRSVAGLDLRQRPPDSGRADLGEAEWSGRICHLSSSSSPSSEPTTRPYFIASVRRLARCNSGS